MNQPTTSRVYCYGLLPPSKEDEAKILEQLRGANKYRNVLIEIERWRREEYDKIVMASPEAIEIQIRIDTLSSEIDNIRASLRVMNKKERAAADGLRERVTNSKKDRRELYEQLKAAKLANRESSNAKIAVLGEATNSKIREARATFSKSVHFTTRGLVDAAQAQSQKGPSPPRFVRFTGEGVIGGQIQTSSSPTSLFTIDRVDPMTWNKTTPRSVRRRLSRTTLHFRVASSPEGKPIWIQFQMIMHRPLPEGAVVTYAKVFRRRHATWWKYELQLTIKVTTPHIKCDTSKSTVLVDLRWSKTEDDSIRAAYWLGSDGRYGELVVPRKLITQLEKANSIRSARDKLMNDLKVILKTVAWPEELTEDRKVFHLWKAPAKFVSLLQRWGDSAPDSLRQWIHRDRHLWQYETGIRTTKLRERDEIYAIFASQLVKQYSAIALEPAQLDQLAEYPPPEKDINASLPAKPSQRFDVAPSHLRNHLVQTFMREGGFVIEVPWGNEFPKRLASAQMLYEEARALAIDKPLILAEKQAETLAKKAATRKERMAARKQKEKDLSEQANTP